MSDYQSPNDLKYAKHLLCAAPIEGQAFLNLKNKCERVDGKIPAKYRELISIAVALTTQCSYCIDTHVKLGHEHGITEEELAEVVFITAALRAGAAVGHGLLAEKIFQSLNGR